MKTFFTFLTAALFVVAVGCNEGTPGGPGAAKTTPPATTTTPDAGTSATTTTTEETTTTREATTPSPATTTDNTVVGTDPVNTFRLDAPNLATTLKQGETQVVTIGISRAKDFDQDVTLEFVDVPKGVTIDPEKPVIKAGEMEVKLNVTAAPDAAINDFTIKMIGHPETGEDATNEFKLSVQKP